MRLHVKIACLIAFMILLLFSTETLPQEPARNTQDQNASFVDLENETLRIKEKLQKEYAAKTDTIIHFYVNAQQLFFRKNYSQALEKINLALDIHKNADLMLLKGTILFKQKKFDEAELYFTQAFKLDKNTPLLPVEGLKEWLYEKNIIDRME